MYVEALLNFAVVILRRLETFVVCSCFSTRERAICGQIGAIVFSAFSCIESEEGKKNIEKAVCSCVHKKERMHTMHVFTHVLEYVFDYRCAC